MRIRQFLLAAVAAFAGAAVAVGVGMGGTSSDGDGVMLVNGHKVFPLVLAKGPDAGATAPDGRSAFTVVAAAGANFLKVGPATSPWTTSDIADANAQDRAAAAAGLSTWINLSTVSQATAGSSTDALLQQVVTSLAGDAGATAIGAWKGADEPLWSGIAPAALQFAYCRSTGRGDRSWCGGESVLDSAHQWVTIEAPRGTSAQLQPYSAVTDIHGVDVYPVTLANTTPNLHDVGTWTRTLASVTPNHAVWTTLQVCHSGSYDTSGHYVLPTLALERYMAYDAIINGARSLAFYGGNIAGCWNDSDRQHGWNWTFWTNVLAPLLGELNASSALAPALINPASTVELAASDPSTEAIERTGANGDVWVIAARSGSGTQPVTISGLPAGLAAAEVYTENRSLTPSADGTLTDTFAQWGVHVYRFRAPVTGTTTTGSTTTVGTTTAAGTTTSATTTPAPPPFTGGGGGGSAVPADLAVSLTATATDVPVGRPVDLSVIVDNRSDGSSSHTHLLITLPPNLKLAGPPYYERGSGCTASEAIDCNLDFLPGRTSTRVAFEVQTPTAGAAVITATASSDNDANAADNSASVPLEVKAPPTATPTSAPVVHTVPHTVAGTARPDTIRGSGGNDLLYGRAGNDHLYGGAGNDVIYGGLGNDVLVGGPGEDRLYGGPGNDTLEAADGRRDTVDCGPGRHDVAHADRLDRISGCERITRTR